MVFHLDPHSLIVLDYELGKVVIFNNVKEIDDPDSPHDLSKTCIYHLDVSGMEQVFDDIESMLIDFGMNPSNCEWMTGPKPVKPSENE